MEIFFPWEVVSQYVPFDIPLQYVPHFYGIFFTAIATFYVMLAYFKLTGFFLENKISDALLLLNDVHVFQPRTFSAQDLSTSELLRTL